MPSAMGYKNYNCRPRVASLDNFKLKPIIYANILNLQHKVGYA